MIFHSLSVLKRYVEKASSKALTEVGKEVEKTLKETIQNEVYNSYSPTTYVRTNKLIDNIVIERNGNNVQVVLKNGGWYSVITGEPFYALWGLESGSTWGRGSTNVVDAVNEKCSSLIPQTYYKAMRGNGIPIVRG